PPYTKTIHRTEYPAISPTNPANSASNKVVLVTGGSAGIGKEIARSFVQAGAKAVAILGRRENLLAEVKKELESLGTSRVISFKADVLEEEALEHAFASTAREVGKIDVVVANAGYLAAPVKLADADLSDWWKAFEVNIKGTLLTFRAWFPHAASNREGAPPTFISVNSGVAHMTPFPGWSNYAVSKLGSAQLIAALQVEHPELRIASFHPGVLGTEMNSKSGATFSLDDLSLPGGFAVWLASPRADFVGGRFFWAHWDVDEMARMQDDIVKNEELTMGLKG
ncbi:hypothetical protein BAUCODRAFT_55458, partial [Baudoinia panamericana UAMH 10762]